MKNNFMKNYDRFVILIWIFLLIIFWLQYLPVMNAIEAFLLAICIILSAYPFTTYLSRNLLQKAMQRKNMIKFITLFFCLSLIYSLLISLIIDLFRYLENIDVFPPSEFMVTWNNLGYEFPNAFLVALFVNFGFCGLRFYEQNMKLHEILIESQMQVLHSQINPHFMFNVLNHVNILIRKEPDLASSILVQYTNILRYQLYSGKKDVVSIKQEVEFLKDFIEIEKMRWKNTLDIRCSWSIEDDSVIFSPLLFITFIENAFKHVSRSKTDKGYVYIDLMQKDRELVLTVENSKYADNLISKNKEESGIGLENIKKRLSILYPNRYNLHINEAETSYSTILTITL